jgi:hypothetical protein
MTNGVIEAQLVEKTANLKNSVGNSKKLKRRKEELEGTSSRNLVYTPYPLC